MQDFQKIRAEVSRHKGKFLVESHIIEYIQILWAEFKKINSSPTKSPMDVFFSMLQKKLGPSLSKRTLEGFFGNETHIIKSKKSCITILNILDILEGYVPKLPDHLPSHYEELDITVISKLSMLQDLYKTDRIEEGLKLSVDLYENHGPHRKILKHLFRFAMRKKKWEFVKNIANEIIESKNDDDVVISQCYLTLCESDIRETLILSLDKINVNNVLKKSEEYLDKVPHIHKTHSKYLYWYGRLYLTKWFYNRDITDRMTALQQLRRSYKEKATWWVHFYICIILKLRGSREFSDQYLFFVKTIRNLWNIDQRSSIRSYVISSFILNDDADGLKDFLCELSAPEDANDYLISSIHHANLIFFNDPEKANMYRNLIENWIESDQ